MKVIMLLEGIEAEDEDDLPKITKRQHLLMEIYSN